MTLREYFNLFRRSWIPVLVATLVGIGGGNLLTLLATPVYSSTTAVLLSLPNDGSATSMQQATATTKDRALTIASLAKSSVVLDSAAAAVGSTSAELMAHTAASAREGESIVDVTVEGTSAVEAQTRARGVAAALSRVAPGLDEPSQETLLVISVISDANLPSTPVTPRPRNNTFFGAVIGLALGVGVVIVINSLDGRIRSLNDLPRGVRFATLTSLPTTRSRVGGGQLNELRLESFRHLRANLQFGARSGRVVTVAAITEVSNADDVARQLAAVLGEIGLRVIVMDMDLRPTKLGHDEVPAAPAPGMAQVLSGAAALKDVIVHADEVGVWLVPAGDVTAASAQLASTPAMRNALTTMEQEFDYILVTSPPVLSRSEASVLAAMSQSSLLVVESGRNSRTELLYAFELLQGVGVESISIALDHVRASELGGRPTDAMEEVVIRSPRH